MTAVLGMGAAPYSAGSGDFRWNLSDGRDGLIALHSTLPPVRGRNTSRSLEDRGSSAFVSYNPLARPPFKHAPLAPFRDDVPLLDPYTGHLSAGSAVVLGIMDRPGFLDSFHHVPSALRVPRGVRERPQTTPTQSSLSSVMSHDKTWNSRIIPDAALRASFFGWNSALKAPENETQEDNKLAVNRIIYTSATQRSYEDVDWDAKLPPRIKPPTTTMEKITDPVSEHSSRKRYHSQPQLCQMTGAQWNRCQHVPWKDVRKPISFCSPCPKSGQIPLYSGTIGSENMDNIDDISGDFQPLTMKRTTVPPYTPSAYRAIIPGYTGRSFWPNCGDSTDVPTRYPGANTTLRTPEFGHKSPLSRMVTTIAPRNPFLNPNISALP